MGDWRQALIGTCPRFAAQNKISVTAQGHASAENSATDAVPHQRGFTFSAWGPFGPWVTSIVTFCPSFNDLNPAA